MKKRQNSLMKTTREGFSLVEIIITIAIMAILVGVIALAVIPNIGRSHESKDLQTLDNIASSVNIAIANNRIGESGEFEIGTPPADGSESRTVYDAVETELGDFSGLKLESGAAEGKKINVSWTIINKGAASIKIAVKDGTEDAVCEYTKGDPCNSEGFRYFRASND